MTSQGEDCSKGLEKHGQQNKLAGTSVLKQGNNCDWKTPEE